MQNPHSCPKGHTFCHTCITRWLSISSTCPFDRTPLSLAELGQNRPLNNLINELITRCPSKYDVPCLWQGSLSDREGHLASCTSENAISANICTLTAKYDALSLQHKLLRAQIHALEIDKIFHLEDRLESVETRRYTMLFTDLKSFEADIMWRIGRFNEWSMTAGVFKSLTTVSVGERHFGLSFDFSTKGWITVCIHHIPRSDDELLPIFLSGSKISAQGENSQCSSVLPPQSQINIVGGMCKWPDFAKLETLQVAIDGSITFFATIRVTE